MTGVITRPTSGFTAPQVWYSRSSWKKAVFYQIYPRSFKDTDGNGIGDLKGIIEKLDYLNDGTDISLGIDAIWICPFFVSPNLDFGYDVADYSAVNSCYGSMDDFDLLLEEAHRRNIRIILDLFLNTPLTDTGGSGSLALPATIRSGKRPPIPQ